MKFLSDRWFSEYEKTLREEFSAEKTTTRESYRMLELYRNCPDGKDRWMLTDIEKGIFFEFRHGEGMNTAPRDPDFRLYADYDTWIRVLSVKDDISKDIVSGKIEFYGPMVKLQPAFKPFVKAVLLQGLIRPDGNVILPHAMEGLAGIIDRKMFR